MESKKKEKPVGMMVKTGKVFSNQILQNGQKKWKIEPGPLDLIFDYQRFYKLELIGEFLRVQL